MKEDLYNIPKLKTYMNSKKISSLEDLSYSELLVFLKMNKELNYYELINLYNLLKRNKEKRATIKKDYDIIFNQEVKKKTEVYIKVKRLKDLKSIWAENHIYYLSNKKIELKSILECIIINNSLNKLDVKIPSYILNEIISKYFGDNSCDKCYQVSTLGNKLIESEKTEILPKENTLLEKILLESIRIRRDDSAFLQYDEKNYVLENIYSNLYLSLFVSKEFFNYAQNMKIATYNDLLRWITPNRIERFYGALHTISLLSMYLKEKYIPSDSIIDKYIFSIGKDKLLPLLLLVVNGLSKESASKMFDIGIEKTNHIIVDYLDAFAYFFDHHEGMKLMMMLFSYSNGYLKLSTLKRLMPKYCNLIIYMCNLGLIYGFNYLNEYEVFVFSLEKVNIDYIFDNYYKVINENEYENLIAEISQRFTYYQCKIKREIIEKRIRKIYNKKFNIYYKGKFLKSYKFRLIMTKFYNGFLSLKLINEFINHYEIEFHESFNSLFYFRKYCVKEDNFYILKDRFYSKNILNKCNTLKKCNTLNKCNVLNSNSRYRLCEEKSDLYYDVIRVCESFRGVFKINDVRNELVLADGKFIRKCLAKSGMFFSLTSSSYIATNRINIGEEFYKAIEDFYNKEDKPISKDRLYNYIVRINNPFIRKYKIRDKKILFSIVYRLVIKNK